MSLYTRDLLRSHDGENLWENKGMGEKRREFCFLSKAEQSLIEPLILHPICHYVLLQMELILQFA